MSGARRRLRFVVANQVFAIVSVALPHPTAQQLFHYAIPENMKVAAGSLVIVPFGSRMSQGIVLEIVNSSPIDEVKNIDSVVGTSPVLGTAHIQMARWMAERYRAPLGRVLEIMIPQGLRSHFAMHLSIRAIPGADEQLRPNEKRLIGFLEQAGSSSLGSIRAKLGMYGVGRIASGLERRGIINRQTVLSRPRMKMETSTLLALTESGRLQLEKAQFEERAPRQADVLRFLAAQPSSSAHRDLLRAETGVPVHVLRLLQERGWITEQSDTSTIPLSSFAPSVQVGRRLTSHQARAVDRVIRSIDVGRYSSFLLHGVTGSGKTEVYIRAIEEALARGKQSIVLVPEIGLTSQVVAQFGPRFPGRLALFHSRMSERDRLDAWRRVRTGQADIAIGTRSALFAPFDRLGVIVVDEEHEPSYKQQGHVRYHARHAALELGRLTNSTVILGSATPSVGTYELAWRGEHELLEMPVRVRGGSSDGRPGTLSPIQLVNMRVESGSTGAGLLSPDLVKAIGETLDRKEQIILFLNRRGAASIVLCENCGFVPRCNRCDVSLTYHASGDEMLCHLCSRRFPPVTLCPACDSTRILYLGSGTQRVVLDVKNLFPSARIARWDLDAMRRRKAIEATTQAFSEGTIDILVGTQAIAKGFDLPTVTLVGIVSADTILHLPDPFATERTFQLLTQVAGRAGRGALEGRVILQTYSPDHPVIRSAIRQDYASFAQSELRFRRENHYPPFGDIARAVFSGTDEQVVRLAAERQFQVIMDAISRQGFPGVIIQGPTPCFYQRVRGRYRWQLVVRGRSVSEVIAAVGWPVGWMIDVDPVSLL